MNDYIFDWSENSEKILNGEGYTTKVHQTFEQIMLFCYLREMGYNKEQIFDLWIKTNSLLLQKIGDDKDQRDKYFGKLLSDSTKYKIEKGNEIKIYQSEIDFINKMEVSMWIKQYVLTMLCIYKWYGKEWCVYNDKIKRFCYSCTNVKREKSEEKALMLSNCIQKYFPYKISNRDKMVSFKILFCNMLNEKYICNIKNPRNVSKIFGLLKNERACADCGKVFEYDYHTVNILLCRECRKKLKYKRKYLNYKNKYKTTDPSAGKTYNK